MRKPKKKYAKRFLPFNINLNRFQKNRNEFTRIKLKCLLYRSSEASFTKEVYYI